MVMLLEDWWVYFPKTVKGFWNYVKSSDSTSWFSKTRPQWQLVTYYLLEAEIAKSKFKQSLFFGEEWLVLLP